MKRPMTFGRLADILDRLAKSAGVHDWEINEDGQLWFVWPSGERFKVWTFSVNFQREIV